MITVRPVTLDDCAAMLAIYTKVVEQTAISFELVPPEPAVFAARVGEVSARYPWLVACDEEGRVLGYCYACSWRGRPAYDWTVEAAIYVGEGCQGLGVGRQLYEALFAQLFQRGFVSVIAGITASASQSIAFHEALGFRPVGVVPHCGYKLGQWHGVAFWQRMLRSPEEVPSPPKFGPARL